MKAAVYYETGGPDVFRYEDVPDPICPPGGSTQLPEPASSHERSSGSSSAAAAS